MVSNDSLHILFIASWFPNRKHLTLGNFVKRHALAVSKKHRVSIIHVVPDKELNNDEWSINQDGNYNEFLLYHKAVKPEWLFRSVHFKRAFKTLKAEHNLRPDIIHLNVIYPAGQHALYLQKYFHVPIVVTEHWTGYHESTHNKIRPWQQRMMLKVSRKAAMICPVSAHLGNAMKRHGIEAPMTVVPNVVDTDLFRLRSENSTTKRIHFLHVSSLFDEHKNVSGLLRGFNRLLANHPDAFLEVLGDGDPEPHQEYAAQLGIPAASISFSGEQPLETIAEKMRQCTALVLFSNYENLPCVIGEAWSSGTPVISTDVGGISEHLNKERGYLIPKGDEGELTLAMSYLIRQPNQFSPSALREYAVNHFSEASIAEAYDNVYRTVLNRKRS